MGSLQSLAELARSHDFLVLDTSVLGGISTRKMNVRTRYVSDLFYALQYESSLIAPKAVFEEADHNGFNTRGLTNDHLWGDRMRHKSWVKFLVPHAQKAGIYDPQSLNHYADIHVAALSLSLATNRGLRISLASSDRNLDKFVHELVESMQRGEHPDAPAQLRSSLGVYVLIQRAGGFREYSSDNEDLPSSAWVLKAIEQRASPRIA